jgi:thiol-disulfide isomerase/thioredoxin
MENPMTVFFKSRPEERMKKLAIISLGILLLFAVGCSKKAEVSSSADAGKLNLTLMDVHDQEHDLRQHLGKVVIIDFWDTWCGPCKREIPHFVELYDRYSNEGLEIVGVAFARSGKNAVKSFGEKYNINYANTLFNDEAGRIFGRPRSIPTTFIIDKKGQIAEKVVGYRDIAFFENKIKELLAAS